jgi:hypothetical protein
VEGLTVDRTRNLTAGLALVAALAPAGWAAPRPAPAKPGRRLAAPVVYQDLVLVVTTADGVAAFAFGDSIQDADALQYGVNYRYRFLPAAGGKEQGGARKVYEQSKPPAAGGGTAGGELFLTAGPVKLQWSLGGVDRGWVYYLPEEARVQVAHANDFGKLDLGRFAK